MTADEWSPLLGAIPEAVEPDKIYVIPTRRAETNVEGTGGELCYPDSVRFFPKTARAADLPVEFSVPEGSRRYLSEFSVDPETWALALACLTMANDWLIQTVSLFISHRAEEQGWTPEEAKRLPLRVQVAETETGRNYQIEGEGADVLDALRELNGSARSDGNDLERG